MTLFILNVFLLGANLHMYYLYKQPISLAVSVMCLIGAGVSYVKK